MGQIDIELAKQYSERHQDGSMVLATIVVGGLIFAAGALTWGAFAWLFFS